MRRLSGSQHFKDYRRCRNKETILPPGFLGKRVERQTIRPENVTANPPPRTEINVRYGYWMPVFGGWLRNVDDENMAPTWDYNKRLAQRSEQIGYSLSLIAELNLN